MTLTRTHAWAAAAVAIVGALLWLRTGDRDHSERASEHRPREVTQPREIDRAQDFALRREIAQLRAEMNSARKAAQLEARDDADVPAQPAAPPRVDPYRDLALLCQGPEANAGP
jgi:hypothetical protein